MRQALSEAIQAGKAAALDDLRRKAEQAEKERRQATAAKKTAATNKQKSAQIYLELVEAFRELAKTGKADNFYVTSGCGWPSPNQDLLASTSFYYLGNIGALGFSDPLLEMRFGDPKDVFVDHFSGLSNIPLELAIYVEGKTFKLSSQLADNACAEVFKGLRNVTQDGPTDVPGGGTLTTLSGPLTGKTTAAIVKAVTRAAYAEGWISPTPPAGSTVPAGASVTAHP
jgi:hypothetical protein